MVLGRNRVGGRVAFVVPAMVALAFLIALVCSLSCGFALSEAAFAAETDDVAGAAAGTAAEAGEGASANGASAAIVEEPTPTAEELANAVPLEILRVYNPNSGEHFYTSDAAERDYLASLGWRAEGVAWVGPSVSNTPVYRMYSGTDHHYTTSAEERDWLVSMGWTYEGAGWYSDDAQTVPLLRVFNPNVDPAAPWNNAGSHHFTTSEEERDALASVGWVAEGVGWYALAGGYGGSDWVSTMQLATQTDQIITVEVRGLTATVSMHVNEGGEWKQIITTTEGWIGRDGLGQANAFASYTPRGVMFPTEAFGIQPDPGCPMGYLQVDWSHYWCGDSASELYNLMVSTRDRTDFDYDESEHIIEYGEAYNYCLNMGWNIEREPYGGAAFFLHCTIERPTSGCVGVPESTMIQILQAVHPGCAIAIGTPTDFVNY